MSHRNLANQEEEEEGRFPQHSGTTAANKKKKWSSVMLDCWRGVYQLNSNGTPGFHMETLTKTKLQMCMFIFSGPSGTSV